MMGIEWFLVICFLVPILMFVVRRISTPEVFPASSASFEPLSDKEFVARSRPGGNAETALKVRAIISDQLAVPVEEIHPEHRFVEDLRAD